MTANDMRIAPGLPQYVAGFSADAFSEPRPAREGHLRVGPFDILRADAGTDTWSGQAGGCNCTVIFDGFLFDRPELCEQLDLPRDASCARIVGAAYARWGADCLTHLHGAYLIAIADADSRRLLIGHDPLGRHPVFYVQGPRSIWFASNVLALAASGCSSRRPNRLSLALTAMTLWPAATETFFQDIKRLQVGHFLEAQGNCSVTERRYWDPQPEQGDQWLSEREVKDSFESKLTRAVDRCMTLDPTGIMLSGGVDSVTVAALAAHYRQANGQPPLVAFSGRSDAFALPEEDMQSRAADALSMPLIVSHTSEWTQNRNDIDVSLEVTPELPGPSRIYWVGTYMGFYRRASAQGLHVLLTGAGGDNWLSVADVHAADLVRRLRFIELWRFISAAANTGGKGYRAAMKRLLWTGGLRPLADSYAALLVPTRKTRFHRERAEAIVPAWLCPETSLRRALVDHLLDRRTPPLAADGRLPRSYYHHSLAAVVNPHLYFEFETAFHVEALCGLRLLSPYHDAELVRFFTHIPPRVLVHGNKYKGLLRPVVERHLPGLGFGTQRKEYPPEADAIDWRNLQDAVKGAWSRFRFERLINEGVVHPDVIEAGGQVSLSSTPERLVGMFALMSAEIWTSVHTV